MNYLIILTIIIVFAVAFVNGMTDAPNAIVSCVTTKSISLKKAVIIASASDFAGSITLSMLNGKVVKTITDIADFKDGKTALIGLSAAMLSVVLWAVTAWFFGIPTSESHALISALAGAGCAVNNGLSHINIFAWKKVIYGLFVSVFVGFAAGFIISKITTVLMKNSINDKTLIKWQVISSAFMSFMHGAQDSQKFTGIIIIALSISGLYDRSETPVWISLLCPIFIAAGTATGGERIIKKIGTDMMKMGKKQGFSSDIAGSLCLLFSTLMGMPVSTTHTKTSAVLGTGVATNFESVNWKIAGEMIGAWLITFPACGVLGYILTRIFT